MIRINLLPHREEKRRARRTHIFVMMFLSVLVAAAVVGLGYLYLENLKETQSDRNKRLTDAITALDRDIEQIKLLKAERQQLLDRKKVVERLQNNRTTAVRLMDQLTRQTPDGIFLKAVKQKDDVIDVQGAAQSNARVSIYMRALEDSVLLDQPILTETKLNTTGNQRYTDFSLKTKISRPDDASEPAAADGKKASGAGTASAAANGGQK